MKVIWSFHCDYCVSWQEFHDDDWELPDDYYCPKGHELVTASKQLLADKPIICLYPTNTYDQVKKQTSEGKNFWVMIQHIHTGEQVFSQNFYLLADALKIVENLHLLPWERALWYLQLKKI
ncbi:hypothetical protein [Herpetosiphon llansteffanensis]|uniref:hypothetical protein n=1 Tax=Herpetosiphon llansteffanensis TaxID=2094568 RepID=UPI000D7C0F1C|nr:hypothetical protein [Herpetosiphon llansteffanensis]